MPLFQELERLVAKRMIDANAEEIDKLMESVTAPSEEQVEIYKYQIARKKLEERADQEGRPKVYVSKEEFCKLDSAMIHEQEEKYHCVFIPADECEIKRMKENAVPFMLPPEPPDITLLNPTMYDTPPVKGGRYHEPPHDLKKKKKANRRAIKQARRKRK